MRQHTIAEKVSCTGAGLHSGAAVQLTLRPARTGTGIVFARTDLDGQVVIPAHSARLQSTAFSTTLGLGDAKVGTVEHVLAALSGLGVDNVRVELDGPELPVMDGSAAPFAYLIRSAGLFAQDEQRCAIQILRPIEIADGDRRIRAEPAERFAVSYSIDFDHPAIGRQQFAFESLDPASFETEIAGARTFGFLRDVEALHRAGLGLGGSLQNTIVLDDDGVMNPEGLRWDDEFVRHKVLDLIGDLSLLGAGLRGRIRVEKGGHTLHQQLVAAILATPDAWRIDHPDRRVANALTTRRLEMPQS